MNRIVFLDFDGVLNSSQWLAAPRNLEDIKRLVKEFPPPADYLPDWARQTCSERDALLAIASLDPGAVQLVGRLVAATGAQVVVSSTWRHGMTIAGLQWMLAARGFHGKVLDSTPSTWTLRTRGQEIAAWLYEHEGEVDRFVILDDDSDMEPYMDRLVLTSRETGLTEDDVKRATQLLVA